jgi:hypothetical protein
MGVVFARMDDEDRVLGIARNEERDLPDADDSSSVDEAAEQPVERRSGMTEIPIVEEVPKRSAATAKQVRLNLVYIDLWSAVKVSSLVALAISITVFLVTLLSWLLLSTIGVVGALGGCHRRHFG